MTKEKNTFKVIHNNSYFYLDRTFVLVKVHIKMFAFNLGGKAPLRLQKLLSVQDEVLHSLQTTGHQLMKVTLSK